MNQINRKNKPCIFSNKLKKNLTLYIFDFLDYSDLSKICSANIYLCNCFNYNSIIMEKQTKKNSTNI